MSKKIFALILALCTVFTLCACGSQSAQTAETSAPQSAPAQTAVPTPTPEIIYIYVTPEVPVIETIIPEKPTANFITGTFKTTQDVNNLLILAEDGIYYYFPLNWYSTQDLDLKDGQKVKIVYQGDLDKEFGKTYVQPVTVLGVLPVKEKTETGSGIWIVDWTPEPVWTQSPYVRPTPQPQYVTKHGYVDSVNTDGGGIYIGVTFDDGSTGRYDISYLWSNPPVIGTRVAVTFDGINVIGVSAA